ncbi:MAG: hypothetical protein A2V70_10515 [Planctomycetes bacterium RBG_13_63_9]|nr:MAG: hypothetical protein A2V70_10515 [Planctomycetes bacterium RBG_13_63_9]
MREISLFAEDYGHESVLLPLITRIAAQYEVRTKIRPVSVRGGYGQVETELGQYVKELGRYKEGLPDLVIVATDANCDGFKSRRRMLQKVADQLRDRVVYAVPDPHIERWLLRDPAAFKVALGVACTAPDQKCQRDRYKRLLIGAVRDAGATPLLGGMEYAEDIVRAMDLGPTSDDDDFGSLLQELHTRFRLWSSE